MYIHTTPVVDIKSTELCYITDIPRFVATLTICGVTHHMFHETTAKTVNKSLIASTQVSQQLFSWATE